MRKVVRGGEIQVPVLQGERVEKASRMLEEAGLVLEQSGERSDPKVEAGLILAQDPPGGSKLKRNRKVRVVVSLGQEVLTVPSLVGQPARRAQIALQQAGLKLGNVAYVSDETAEADRVLAQEPPPGARRGRQESVNLLVSRGRGSRVWVMPRVEGLDISSATRLLGEAGFRVANVRHEATAGAAPGAVTQQFPPAGHPLREGDSISLVVSTEEDGG